MTRRKHPSQRKIRSHTDIPKVCRMEDCEKPVIALGLCNAHYKIALEIEKRMRIAKGELTPMGKNGRPMPGIGTGVGAGGAPQKLAPDASTIKRIRDLAGLQCTKAEISGVLQVTHHTFSDFLARYPEVEAAYEEGRLDGRASLRRMQFVMAKRSAAMGIHLGRQYLDQFDRRNAPQPIDAGFLMTGDPASEEAPSALLRAVKAETE